MLTSRLTSKLNCRFRARARISGGYDVRISHNVQARQCVTARSSRPVAIVTGGTRGIGSGISDALAHDGFDLLLTYNSNKAAARNFEEAIKMKHDDIHCELVGGDLSKPETRDQIFSCYDEKFSGKRLGVAVHNAGQYLGITSSNEAGLGEASAAFGDNNLLGDNGKPTLQHIHFYQALYGDAFIDICERAIARMDDKHGGSLIGISSPGVTSSQPVQKVYSLQGSGKCVMEYSMRIFAVSAAAKNINCNVVVPGVTLSDGWEKVAEKRGMTSEELTGFLSKKIVPMQRPLNVRGLGDVVAFLCSKAGRYVTGVALPVDGGLHLGAM